MVRRSRVHFVHCLLPKAEAVGGGGEPRVVQGESPESGLMTLDVGLLRAQLRGSKLLDALRIYRQGNEVLVEILFFNFYFIYSSLVLIKNLEKTTDCGELSCSAFDQNQVVRSYHT